MEEAQVYAAQHSTETQKEIPPARLPSLRTADMSITSRSVGPLDQSPAASAGSLSELSEEDQVALAVQLSLATANAETTRGSSDVNELAAATHVKPPVQRVEALQASLLAREADLRKVRQEFAAFKEKVATWQQRQLDVEQELSLYKAIDGLPASERQLPQAVHNAIEAALKKQIDVGARAEDSRRIDELQAEIAELERNRRPLASLPVSVVCSDGRRATITFDAANDDQDLCLESLRRAVAAALGISFLQCRLPAQNHPFWWKRPLYVEVMPFEVGEGEFSHDPAIRPLGHGANGVVMAVTARSTNVAAKTHFAFDEKSFQYSHEWVRKFALDVEAELSRITSMPHHPHILAPVGVVRCSYQREDEPVIPNVPKWVLYERCNRSLEEVLNRSTAELTPREAFVVVRHVGLAIEHAHLHNVAHCDIKPANILVLQGRYVLGDFGESTVADRTQTRCAMGTSLYMAPEVSTANAEGKRRWGLRADWWSLGVVCLALIDKCRFKNKKNLVDTFFDSGRQKTSQEEIEAFMRNNAAGVGSDEVQAADCTLLLAAARGYLVIDPELRGQMAW